MNTHHTISMAVRRTLLVAALTATVSSVAQAQDQQSTSGAEGPETVVVTGSRIRRTNEGALPVQTVTQEQIQRTGAVNAEQFLQSVSVAVQGNTNTVAASGSGATTGGVSSISLRGLGSQRTLVLVNGRRLSGGGTITDSTSVDVNSIPLAAVQRVDVLKEGASAVYGSDAIAGVVNFILREDYEGAELTANYGDTTEGGGAIKRVNGVLGLGDLTVNRYNVMFVASYQKEDPLFGRERDFASSGINVATGNDITSGNSFPANIAAADGSFTGSLNPLAGNCSPSVSDPEYFGTGVCRYDPSPFVSLLPEIERSSAYGALHFALTDDIQLYAEASYNRNENHFVIQPVPLSDQFALPPNHPLFNVAPYNGFSTVVLQPSSPYYPTALVQGQTGGATPDLLVRYRSQITGNRDLTDTATQPRGVLGVKGIVAGWDFDAGYLYSRTKLTEHVNSGYPSYLGILPLLNSGQVNFFGENTPEVQALADATQFRGDAYSTRTSLQSVAASVSKDVLTLPAGALGIAFGAEGRQEKFSTDPSAEIQSGDISGYGGNFLPISKTRDVGALFAEMNVPIIKGLEAGAAVRYDHYQGTGSKTVPRFNVRYRPIEQVMARASYGKGFRAPSLTELYQPQVSGVSGPGVNDPQRCGVPDANGVINQDSRDCATQFPIVLGGNTALRPEQSENYTLGLVLEPIRDFSIGFDAFKVNLKDTIIFGVTPAAILADPGQFESFVTRGPADPATPGLPGHVTNIDQTNLNFGETRIEGIDVDVRYRFTMQNLGSFTAGIVGSYFQKYDVQNPDGSFTSIAGIASFITNGAGGVVPRWHHYLSLAWDAGDWQVSAAQNLQSQYQDLPGTFEDTTDPAFAPRTVNRYITYDLQGAYTGIANTRLALGARNVTNKDPPYTNAGGQNFFQAGYDPGYADPRGRFIYGLVTYSFAGK
jgi:iron complex outermembrane receptor protein